MTQFTASIPYMISILTGFFALQIFYRRKEYLFSLHHLFLAGGLGLGLNGTLTFFSFIIFNQLNKTFILSINLTLLFVLFITFIILLKNKKFSNHPILPLHKENLFSLITLMIISFPLWYMMNFYVHGGWDAWSTWNLKAKFLFFGAENWDHLFSPLLWRTSPHYPLLLPLINVWGWLFLTDPIWKIPIMTSFLYTFFTVGLLYTSIRTLMRSWTAFIPVIVLLSMPYFLKMALSQYCDIVVSFYLLASILCLFQAKVENCKISSLLSGLFLGFLSFSKSEGLMAALLIIALSFPYLLWKNQSKDKFKMVQFFLTGAAVTLIPVVLFHMFFSPGNQTFINGLFSTQRPITLHRFQIIPSYTFMEFINPGWNGLWIVLLVASFCGWKKGFSRDLLIIPVFIGLYMGLIWFYYLINTYFEIMWWMQVTLNRILFTLIPVVIFWVMTALWEREKEL